MDMKLLGSATLLAGLSLTAQASDIQRGQDLHNQYCISCHADIMGGNSEGIYTRSNRRIEDYAGLIAQVSRCKDNLGVTWPEDEVRDVAEYLNHSYYHFKKGN